ncbi:tol-pal system protein YbgF [Marinicella sp. S1101]|uniref:tol-pal system protein YbgF n=1 Tax=Marinicella marina TaxID=2996016 RepID=UPI002260FCC1|nr:tol-pal system protein YbgF [Marinicella marina]MCX7552427.1 tol-pal system protein YbgF [Marinicella marina]MDJ1139302.1 tol-pal system protein YbgF [Marinicella marina]
MKHITIMALSLLITQVATAQKMSIQDRLLKLEQETAGQSNNNVGDLVIQVQQLQAQIAQLQGTIEEQNFKISELQERQKVLYVDVDSRLTQLEQGKLAGAVNNNNELVVDSSAGDQADSTVRLSPPELGRAAITPPEVRESVDAQLSTNSLNQASLNATSNTTDPAIDQAYQNAFSQLKAGRFNESARLFEDFIQANPNHELTDNSYYWLGESYYVTRNYPLALSAFQTLANEFPLSSKLADSLLKIGYTYHELEDFQQAQQALNKVVESFPNESVARLAQNRLNLLRREGKIN